MLILWHKKCSVIWPMSAECERNRKSLHTKNITSSLIKFDFDSSALSNCLFWSQLFYSRSNF